MPDIAIRHLEKVYPNGVKAVNDVNIDISDGDFLVLLGPSGCGKSTILMMMVGLEQITGGEILIDGKCVNNLSPRERDVGLVFQSYALLPNLNVYDNIGFGLTIRKEKKAEKDRKIREAAAMLGLEEVLNRKPSQLSGGQKQRVAIGRCIVRNARVLLFDEPLSNLDAKLRVQMRKELISLHRMLKATILYVTHDQVEAMTMATKIAVMKDGTVQQLGTPEEVFNKPANVYVATFVGVPKMNILRGCFHASAEGGHIVLKGGEQLPLEPGQASALLKRLGDGAEVLAGIRPDRMSPAEGAEGPQLKASIRMVEKLGMEQYIYCSYHGEEIVARTLWEAPEPGADLTVAVDRTGIVFFDPESEMRIPTEDLDG